MATNRKDCLDDIRHNPKRREMCDWLIGAGEPDYFDQVRIWSNYDLERQIAHVKHKQVEDAKMVKMAPS